MKTIFPFLKPYRGRLILVGAMSLISTLCSLFMPYLMSDIVDEGIRNNDMNAILGLGAGMLGLSALALGCGILCTRLNSRISTGFGCALQKGVFQKINTLTFYEYEKIGTSSLLTRSTDDIFNLQDAAYGFVYALVTVPVLFVGGAVLAFTSDWLLALVLLILAPAVLFLVWLVTRKMGALWENSDKFIDLQNKIVRERLSGLRVIRAFDKEDHEHERVADATREMAKNIIKANVLSGLINPISGLLLNLSTMLMLYIGAIRIQSEALLKAGDVIATIQYVALIMNGLLVLSWAFAWMPHLKVCIRRVSEVLSMQGMPADTGTAETLCGELNMEHVTFRYENAEQAALSDVSLHASPGEVIALIGGTGSGKSSIAKLLMAFYAPNEGQICLGGKDYAAISRHTIRRNLAIALQKSMIFEGSIADNIRMGDKEADDEKLREMADISQILDFIDAQPDGMAHHLAQSGANLSGGQKQRINIARTIAKQASVYLFDDSFSALDYLTESKLRRRLNAYLNGKTQIIITQRAATAMRCDRIYVLDQGRVVGEGSHEQLLERCRIYREIVESQLGGQNAAKALHELGKEANA